MLLKAKLRQCITWLAMCAVLFGSLAPSLAQASVAFTGKQWIEICTATGTAHIQVDVDNPSLSDAPDAPEQCPFLLLLQHLPPLPSAALIDLPAPPVHDAAFPSATELPSLALQFRVAHPAHAPPSFS